MTKATGENLCTRGSTIISGNVIYETNTIGFLQRLRARVPVLFDVVFFFKGIVNRDTGNLELLSELAKIQKPIFKVVLKYGELAKY